jgi:predicted DNA-binding transcriptional regulator YafY
MSTTARLLQLLSLLQTHRYWPGPELAGRLEVSPRTLRRDVERLRDLGYPVDAGRGVGGGYQLRAGAALPPMLLEADEAVAVAVALRTASASVSGIEDAALGALAKLVQVMPPPLRRRVDALHAYTVPAAIRGPVVSAEDLTVLAQACRDAERVRLRYAPRGRPAATRTVEPHRLVARGRLWYLLAWDLERADWRTFRVDRLTAPETTGARFRPRDIPGGDAARFVQASIDSRPRHDVRLLVQAPAERVRRVAGAWADVREVDGESCEVRMETDSLEWPVAVVGAVGAEFSVVHPPELVAYLAGTGERLLRAAGSSG